MSDAAPAGCRSSASPRVSRTGAFGFGRTAGRVNDRAAGASEGMGRVFGPVVRWATDPGDAAVEEPGVAE